MARAQNQDKDGHLVVAINKKARHRFVILDEVEAGLVLRGTEVKALRERNISLDEAYGLIQGLEVWLVGAHIQPYTHGNVDCHAPTRRRKLLLRRQEIRRLKAKVTQKGLTLVPLAIYFTRRGLAKVKLAVCRGKKVHDRRQEMKKRDDRREIRGALGR